MNTYLSIYTRYLHYYQRYHGHSVALKYAAGERHRTDKVTP